MNFLDRIDNYYKSKKASEVWMMTILLAAVVGYLIYTLFGADAEEFKNTQEAQNIAIKKKINANENYLRKITINGDRDFYIKDLNKKIIQKKAEINQYRKELQKINGSMNKLKDMLYTNDNWSKFLHNITKLAAKNNLDLYDIENKKYDQNSTFAKVLDVNIKAKGKYQNILLFMNELEQTKLVTNISDVTLQSNGDRPIVDINLSVWSIRP